MSARWYAATVLFAVVAAALVLWRLETAGSTACFRNTVSVAAEMGGELSGCDAATADAVTTYLSERLPSEESGQATELEARSALLIWMALFAATAGLAAIAAVRSAATIAELRARWSARLVALSAASALVVAAPFVGFRLLASSTSDRLSPFGRLHLDEFAWLNPFIAALALVPVVGLVAVGEVVTASDRRLEGLAWLGSRMRRLVGLLAAIVTMSMVTTAARWDAIATLPGGEALPSTVVLVWGAMIALGLAVVYVPVHQLWATAAEREIAAEVRRQLGGQETQDGTPGFRGPELALENELRATLGVGGPLRAVQGSLAVLAPVIAAAVSSLFA